MEIYTCIDWLSFTSHDNVGVNGVRVPPYELESALRPDTPRFGYRKAYRTEAGLLMMFDGTAKSMGTHYQYSGTCLKSLFARLADYEPILRWHGGEHHRCTRIDLAIDVLNSPGWMAQVHDELSQGRYTGTARKINIIKSVTGPGETIYAGSRQSELFVRIYDKAAEQRVDDDWTRIEVECKGDRARGVMGALLSDDNLSLAALTQSLIQHVVKVNTDGWREVFTAQAVTVAPPVIKEHDTEGWILGVVASALIKFEQRYPERRLADRLFEILTLALGETPPRRASEASEEMF